MALPAGRLGKRGAVGVGPSNGAPRVSTKLRPKPKTQCPRKELVQKVPPCTTPPQNRKTKGQNVAYAIQPVQKNGIVEPTTNKNGNGRTDVQPKGLKTAGGCKWLQVAAGGAMPTKKKLAQEITPSTKPL